MRLGIVWHENNCFIYCNMRYKNNVTIIIMYLMWLLFLTMMHLACFDVLDVNAWYFYLIAIGSFLFQIMLLYLLKRKTSSVIWIVISEIIYVILTFIAVVVLLKGAFRGLLICFLCLNAFGIVSCNLLRRITKNT